ncbi:MAG: ABC transporter permease [Actinobacteria bacterium]|nr:ABC transporter permease [Actinomycetota bacterium]
MNADAQVEARREEPDKSMSSNSTGRFGGINKVLRLDRLAGLYLWLILIVAFSIWMPDTFATTANVRTIAGGYAVTAIVAIGLILPLAADVFDLSVAATLGFAACLVLELQGNGINAAVAVLITFIVGLAIGAVNGLLVVRFHMNSFIATLGMSSIVLALTLWLTGGQQVFQGVSENFVAWGQKNIWGIPAPVFYLVAIAAIVWYVLEFTPAGRYIYGTGGNRQAARLAGVRVDRVIFASLTMSSAIAAIAGIVLAARLGAASPEQGSAYLIPAFTAVFLGATQFKASRFNVLGTLVAVYLLATGVTGIQLAGAESFVPDLFNGLALIVAVAIASSRGKGRR